MEDEITMRDVLRYFAPGYLRQSRLDRWNHIYDSYHGGESLESLAEHYGLHVSTITRLLKRAVQERKKTRKYVWPRAEDGRRICDIDSPMPQEGRPCDYHHQRAYRLKGVSPGKRPKAGFCPVCRRSIVDRQILEETYRSLLA